ncbi:helix-turn-helix transcriptional regulator [Nocardia sp. NBC_00403]|uniref:helix-turn-helix transcriptional regulator n=1 Tax=Nocardia sp. NBC_00403 TaxID=2975990 RepID=UPI002E20A215
MSLGVLVAGPAGVGKSRLLTEAVAHWRARGRPCHYFHASRSAQAVPLGLFAAVADAASVDPLRRIRAVVTALTHCDDPAVPVLLVIDDAHLLDDQSSLVLTQIVHHHLATALLAVRTGADSPDAVTALWKDQRLRRLDLQPLSVSETATLLTCVLDGQVEHSAVSELWRYTRGNVLHLRHLVDGELAAARLVDRGGVWVWQRGEGISSPLAELIESTIARQSPSVLAVIDLLSVSDPIETTVLEILTGVEAIGAAVDAALVTLDTVGAGSMARLAHPLLGEGRRARTTPSRLRALRGQIATALASCGTATGLVDFVRRAVLVADSDLPPDPLMFAEAAEAALRLADPATAERLARRAVETGGARAAQIVHARTLLHCDRYDEALSVNTALQDSAESDREAVLLTLSRITYMAGKADYAATAAEVTRIEKAANACGLHRPYNAIAAWAKLPRDHPAAITHACAALQAQGWLDESFGLFALTSLVAGHSMLGNYKQMTAAAEDGYRLAGNSADAATLHYIIGIFHLEGYCLGGYLDAATELVRQLDHVPGDFPTAFAFRAIFAGMLAYTRGELSAATSHFREALAIAASFESVWLPGFAQLSVATLAAMAGDNGTATTLLDRYEPFGYPDPTRFTYAHLLARAWTQAAAGTVTHAIALANQAADLSQEHRRPAQELMAAQTATQFGDRTQAHRLGELTRLVEGPRPVAAALHATALSDWDPAGLVEAARCYEEFGDLVAAADTFAQAADLLRRNGYRGAALTATASARRLAAITGADTPALRANNVPSPLTTRQREVIALVAAGLTNRQIAEKLVMSVRTVEGHLFRASRKTGITTRAGLAAALDPTAKH